MELVDPTDDVIGMVAEIGAESVAKIPAPIVTYAHYVCVADGAAAMAYAWKDTAGCAQAICMHENLLK